MSGSAPTVPALKESFITAQTNLLSQPLAPSRNWQRANNASNQPIPTRLLDDALFSLSQTIQQHCRRVYPPQASYNVAEQISNSYLRDAEDRVTRLKESESSIGRELDLADEAGEGGKKAADDSIETLPTSWPVESDVADHPSIAAQYEAIVQRLTDLTEQRGQMRHRVRHFRRIEASIRPLSNTDANEIQDNLVTPGGPIEQELDKMRLLLARVADRVVALPEQPINNSNGTTAQFDSAVKLGDLSKARKRNIDNFLSDANVFPS
ncbi:hypothetical protein AAL_08338 [Moelleriella libera RCEF 2490]|uniref:Kinetochore protein fta4 n=1 Tax=Moelleriella libera RCEF 2490 TaxID=1081109 RepID=A0A167VKQ4_9HYPO|nr:hypothetical protein AAL_08338 [Moelleriella libera RCEF 2490]